MRAFVALVAALVVAPPAGAAAQPGLQTLVGRHVPAIEEAGTAARSSDPDAVQARYDAARDLQAALAGRAAPRCRSRYASLARYAAAHVRAAEAFDRLRPGTIARHDAAARAALADVRRRACGDDRLVPAATPSPLRRADVQAAAVLGQAGPRLPRDDAALAGRLAEALRGFDGDAAVWVHDMRTGRAAGVRTGERYPAASTVKLGLLVASLSRFGADRAVAHDLETLTSWSSNLAANRLWRLVGGDATLADTLRRLGATESTYPGPYRAGTSRTAPPLVSRRVTTARDLGRILTRLHGAALGVATDLLATRLTRRQARIALGLLMAADDREGALVPPVPAARKHGWLQSARHTAAILYGPRGPVVVVLLTYRDGISVAAAQRLGARVAAVALRRA